MAEITPTKQTRRRPLMIGGLALLAVAVLAIVILLIDPFGWNLLDKASGLRDEAAAAMPPEAILYAEIDLVNLDDETLTDFSRPFITALAEPGIEDLGGGLERLDAILVGEVGLTLTDDIRPWLGRSVGVALTDLSLMPDGQIDQASWLLVAGTQDRSAADEFLEKLSTNIAETSGVQPLRAEHRGRTITTFGPDAAVPLGGVAFTRSAGQVIVGSDADAVRAAVDAQMGDSLADHERFKTLTQRLPPDSGLTLYVDQSRAPQLGRLLATAAPIAIGPLDLTNLMLPPAAVGVSIVEQGLRLDTVTLNGGRTGTTVGDAGFPTSSPHETLAFLSGDSLDAVWQSLKRSLEAGGGLEDFEESMALISREFGYDPNQQLLPLLDRPWTLTLLPSDEGLVSELTALPLGLVLLAGSDNVSALEDSVTDLNQSFEDQRLPLETIDVSSVSATTVDLASLIGASLPLYGIYQDGLFLATDAQALALVLNGDGSIGDEGSYSTAADLLPDAYQVTAYGHLPRLLAQLEGAVDERLLRLLSPVNTLIAGNGPAVGDVAPGVVYIVIEQ